MQKKKKAPLRYTFLPKILFITAELVFGNKIFRLYLLGQLWVRRTSLYFETLKEHLLY